MADIPQDMVDKLVGQAREEGRASAKKELQDKHQFELDKLQGEIGKLKTEREEIVKQFDATKKEFDEAKGSWAKQEEEFKKLQSEHTNLKTSVEERDFEDELVTKHGVKPEHKKDLRILLKAQNLLVDEKGEPKDLGKVIAEVKPKYAAFFASSDKGAPGTRNTANSDKPPAKYDILAR